MFVPPFSIMTAAKVPCRHGLWLVARVIQIGPLNQLSICNAKKPPSYISCKKTDINRVTTPFRLFLTKETSPSTFLYSAAITGGSCRSLTFRLGAPLRSHLPFTLSHPSQLPGILCNDSRACTLFVTVFLFMTIVYRSIYVCICKVSVNFTSSDIFSLLLLSGSAPVLPGNPAWSGVLLPCQIRRSVYQSVHRCP